MKKIFNFEFKREKLRVQIIKKEPWFVLRDISEALDKGISSLSKDVDDSERKRISIEDSSGKAQPMIHISVLGLFSLSLDKNKAREKEFIDWITHHVLSIVYSSVNPVLVYPIPEITKVDSMEETPISTMSDAAHSLSHAEKASKLTDVITKIYSQLNDLSPDLADILVRYALKDIVCSLPEITSFQNKRKTIYEIAEQLGYPMGGMSDSEKMVETTGLNTFVQQRLKENGSSNIFVGRRLIEGVEVPLSCYDQDDPIVKEAILTFYNSSKVIIKEIEV